MNCRPNSRLLLLCAPLVLATGACKSDGPNRPTDGDGGSGGIRPDGEGGSGGKGTGGNGGTAVGTGGVTGGGGSPGGEPDAGPVGGGGTAGAVDAGTTLADASAAARFSFFVTSMAAMRALAKNDKGFGGDLRFGKPDGLSGADEICSQIAERSMPGNGKTWRAFLSVTKGPGGSPVNAIDRVGEGPWYDRKGRLLAMTKQDLLQPRPAGAHVDIVNDLPNETGASNRYPNGPGTKADDNHATLTGSGPDGKLWRTGLPATCQDWTSADPKGGKPHVGYTFPRGDVRNWISIFDEPGCAAGGTIEQAGGADPSNPTVGSSGGYGAFYCFALTP